MSRQSQRRSLPVWLHDVQTAGDKLSLFLRDGEVIDITAQTLHDNAPARINVLSGQRGPSSTMGIETPRISRVESDSHGLIVNWNEGAPDHYPFDVLEQYWLPPPAVSAPTLWDAADASLLPVFDYDGYLHDDDILECALAALLRYGFVRLADATREPQEVETAIARFGYVRETNYGRVFDVRIKPQAVNLADTDKGLEPHTDNPYRNPVPGLQLLHALQAADSGGGSVLVDGFKAAAILKAENPAGFALLRDYPATFDWSDGYHFFTATAPVITEDRCGDCCAIRFNHRAFRCAAVPVELADQWRQAYRALGHIIENNDLRFCYTLNPGDMVLMDNERILHGRDAYHSQVLARWLQGTYADKDAARSTLARLVRNSVETVIDEISALFAGERAQQHYGEAVSISGHMLQTAANLAADGEPDALVAAGLLHDIGWILAAEAGHEDSGADYLLQRFGTAVSEPVRLHVAAKRWLVATSPHYYDTLSDESRRTLVLQGGPLPEQDCAAFAGHPFFRQAIALRLADDQGKSTEVQAGTIEDYLPLLRRLAFRTA